MSRVCVRCGTGSEEGPIVSSGVTAGEYVHVYTEYCLTALRKQLEAKEAGVAPKLPVDQIAWDAVAPLISRALARYEALRGSK